MSWFSRPAVPVEAFLDPLSVVLPDEVHTSLHPYCDDVACWCHTNVAYHEVVTHPEPTEEEVEASFSFFGFRRS